MRITNAEAVIMDCLWRRSPLAADDIVAEVAEPQGWSEATVRTLVNRLMNKKAIAAAKDGRRFLYRPLVAREEYVSAESQGLLDRLFDGRLAPLVAHLTERGRLAPGDVAEIKRLIEKLDADENDGR
ncbi:MAG: BlaI/MecI/CopY family transcriptional regulator [Maricaulaceae bacterium]|jgi:predicted transcriptional regulator